MERKKYTTHDEEESTGKVGEPFVGYAATGSGYENTLVDDNINERSLRPYTKMELSSMVAESEMQLANGQWQDFDEAMDELEREFAEEDKEIKLSEAL
jgi:hypothetical protein